MADLMERTGIQVEQLKATHNVLDSNSGRIRFPFSSSRKRMSTIIENATGNGGYDKRLHIKGASELILKCCTHYMNEQGQQTPLDDNTKQQILT